MRLLSFTGARGPSWGVLDGAGVVDLGARPSLETPTLADALRDDGLMGIAMNAVGLPPDHDPAELALLPPVPRPARMFHADADDPEATWSPLAGPPVAPGGRFAPAGRTGARWRPGIAAVVGSAGSRVPPERASETLAGYTCYADWPAGETRAAALGPYLVTPDEFLTADGRLTARIDGRPVLRHAVTPLLGALRELLVHVSARTAMAPGDVLAVTAPGPDRASRRGWAPTPGARCRVELPLAGALDTRVAHDAVPDPPGGGTP
ncbi:fumarylacetoacetate hydrolase family protein [Streptomyces sp. PTD5-9]|uniref:fumarylacetoacetate hydrolase family protein n=1 Tax=Streptomyces sp. PTD5-9 TaxID=3120150 RepID=UPI00300981DB